MESSHMRCLQVSLNDSPWLTDVHRQQRMAWWMLVSLPSFTSSIVKIYLKSQHQKSPYKPFVIAILPPWGNLPKLCEKNSVQNQIARLWKAFKMPSATWASWLGNLQVGGTSMANVVMPFHLFYIFLFRQRFTSRHKDMYIYIYKMFSIPIVKAAMPQQKGIIRWHIVGEPCNRWTGLLMAVFIPQWSWRGLSFPFSRKVYLPLYINVLNSQALPQCGIHWQY